MGRSIDTDEAHRIDLNESEYCSVISGTSTTSGSAPEAPASGLGWFDRVFGSDRIAEPGLDDHGQPRLFVR
ncbi:hypothetical protein ACFY1S_25195 [Micromonospora sp. NPDC000663]|uniref:hypothetical protein n=1 Tax=Micromonospora sp. NPDC000663 TaxID=3364218 RepID=UPI0036BF42D5